MEPRAGKERRPPAATPPRPAQRVESREAQVRRLERQPCDVCSTPMTERACRYQCPQCGYQRDCEDP